MILARLFMLAILTTVSHSLLWSGDGFISAFLLFNAVSFLIGGLILFPQPGRLEGRALGKAAIWCVLVVALFLVNLVLRLGLVHTLGSGLNNSLNILLLALGMGGVLYICCTAVLALSQKDRRQAGITVLALLLVLTAAPVWLGPVLLFLPDDLWRGTSWPVSQWLASSILMLSPLTFLSLLIDTDFLRIDWFYQNTPFGGMRFSYPPIALFVFSYLLVIFFFTGFREYSLRKKLN